MTDKVDLKKDLDAYHAAPRDFRIMEVPDLQYLMIDRHITRSTAAMRARSHPTGFAPSCASPSVPRQAASTDCEGCAIRLRNYREDNRTFLRHQRLSP